MELTPEQIKEFEAITDYSEKLKWWQERFGYDLTPHGQNMTIVPQSIEETKLLIDWYEEGYAKLVSNITYEFDIDKCEHSFGEVLHKFSQEERIAFLSRRKSETEQYFSEYGTLVDIKIGITFEENPKLGLEKFFKSITNSPLPSATIQNFFNGRYNKRQLNIISDFLTDYPEVNKTRDLSKDNYLKWNCSPAIAGFIISELIAKGYIEAPTTNSEWSYSKTAKICSVIFEITGDKGRTTVDHLKNVLNPERNTLPEYKKKKLEMPQLDDIK